MFSCFSFEPNWGLAWKPTSQVTLKKWLTYWKREKRQSSFFSEYWEMSPEQQVAEAEANAVLEATAPAWQQSYEIPPTVINE